ncbi:hypothetical protein SORBI_3001G121800 [Sorghum bicolor]|uniref:Uncharacterized protein n=1 Tax=Sorghum bicolor TaxID=4558 RepID=A0A1B6QIL6_SORBI|nr:hypothetical protein SORBI_3001G121800 [Sorghum bicolor]
MGRRGRSGRSPRSESRPNGQSLSPLPTRQARRERTIATAPNKNFHQRRDATGHHQPRCPFVVRLKLTHDQCNVRMASIPAKISKGRAPGRPTARHRPPACVRNAISSPISLHTLRSRATGGHGRRKPLTRRLKKAGRPAGMALAKALASGRTGSGTGRPAGARGPSVYYKMEKSSGTKEVVNGSSSRASVMIL